MMTAMMVMATNPLMKINQSKKKAQHRLAKMANGKNAKDLMVLLVVKSNVLLILVFSNVTMVPILKVLPKQNVSRMLIRLSHGIRISVHALLAMTTLPTKMMTLLTETMTLLLAQHQLVKMANGKNVMLLTALLVVKSNVLLIPVFSNVTVVPILKVLPRPSVLKTLTRPSHGTKISEPVLIAETIPAMKPEMTLMKSMMLIQDAKMSTL